MKYIIGSDSLTASVQGKPYTVNKSAEIYQIALQALRDNSESAFLNAVDMKTTISSMFSSFGDVQVQGKSVTYNGREITGLIARRVFEMLELKLPITPVLNLISNLMKNPSKRAVDESFGFVDACNLPITEDGCILAYRKVGEDYMDLHSRSVPNKPAELFSEEELDSMPIVCGKQNEVKVYVDENDKTVIEMDRNLVDEDKDRTCSQGLHAASYNYLEFFGGTRLLVVKINPCDIVAVPSDYSNSKLRTCKYEILEEMVTDDQTLPLTPLTQASVLTYGVTATSKMNFNSAQKLREDVVKGMSKKQASEKYGISRRQVGRIVGRYAWV